MLEKTETFTLSARPFECDFTGSIFLSSLCNQLLNCAEQHAAARGFGVANLLNTQHTWVLTRLALEINRRPAQNTTYKIATYIEKVLRLFTNRNFIICDPNNTPIGYARTIWALINTRTRKTADLSILPQLNAYELPDKLCPIAKPGHIKPEGTPASVQKLILKYSDIDINRHVNSTKYIQHILNLFPAAWHQTHLIKRFEISYISETYAGDALRLNTYRPADNFYIIEATKDDQPVCRARIQTNNINPTN